MFSYLVRFEDLDICQQELKTNLGQGFQKCGPFHSPPHATCTITITHNGSLAGTVLFAILVIIVGQGRKQSCSYISSYKKTKINPKVKGQHKPITCFISHNMPVLHFIQTSLKITGKFDTPCHPKLTYIKPWFTSRPLSLAIP